MYKLLVVTAVCMSVANILFAGGFQGRDKNFEYSMEWSNNQIRFSRRGISNLTKDKNWQLDLPGQIYEPAKDYARVAKESNNLSTPLQSAISHFSASCDKDWLIAGIVPGDPSIQSLQRKDVFDRNCSIFKSIKKMHVLGEAQYKDYKIIFLSFIKDNGAKLGAYDWVFKKSGNQWLFTNELAGEQQLDGIFYILSATNGELKNRK